MHNTRKPRRQGYSDNRRYFFFVGGKLRRYTPKPGDPAPLAVRYHRKWRMIYVGHTDAEYFAAHPDAQGRFTVRIDTEALHWRFRTRQGGEIVGDRYDLDFDEPGGTAPERLKRRLLRFATVERHMVRRDAPDLVSALS